MYHRTCKCSAVHAVFCKLYVTVIIISQLHTVCLFVFFCDCVYLQVCVYIKYLCAFICTIYVQWWAVCLHVSFIYLLHAHTLLYVCVCSFPTVHGLIRVCVLVYLQIQTGDKLKEKPA